MADLYPSHSNIAPTFQRYPSAAVKEFECFYFKFIPKIVPILRRIPKKPNTITNTQNYEIKTAKNANIESKLYKKSFIEWTFWIDVLYF